MELERRIYDSEMRVETREDGVTRVSGHAAVFNSRSENLGGFREIISPGAFDKVLDDDIRALFNHDPSRILGRSTANTLEVGVDKKGLAYEYVSPDTSYARDLIVSLNRGDVTQSSFGFSVSQDEWDEDEDGILIRTVTSVSRLYDVSPVTFPAYPDTDVAKRHLNDFLSSRRSKRARVALAQKRRHECYERFRGLR